MEKGYLLLVLHAHLPFVRHPEYDYFLEENWFFEAITETYIPLLQMFEELVRDDVDFRISMSITPPLMEMLSDKLLQDRYVEHINKLVDLAEKEVLRTMFMPDFNKVAKFNLELFESSRTLFCDVFKCDLINGFKKFQDIGKLEIITCTATHGFLPLMDLNKHAVEAQIKIAVDTYKNHLGKQPNGIWLAECGYYKKHDELLKKHGISFFFTDAHGVLFSEPRPRYGVFAPVFCKTKVAAFGRELESSRSVWSAEVGYPGHPEYREFYRDIGFDLDFDYIRDYIHPDGIRINTGIKYYRITGKNGEEKEIYDPVKAKERAKIHARHFYDARVKQIEKLSGLMDRPPVIISPYDAELYGHWWFEGPVFLNQLLRCCAEEGSKITSITPVGYLEKHPENQVVQPSISSWGSNGYAAVWLSECNDWIYRYLIECSDRMVELATFHDSIGDVLVKRALAQAARELLLAQSSDWPFIITTNTMVPYAIKRVKQHISRFLRLYNDIKNKTIDAVWLANIEYIDNIFPDIDYSVYKDSEKQ